MVACPGPGRPSPSPAGRVPVHCLPRAGALQRLRLLVSLVDMNDEIRVEIEHVDDALVRERESALEQGREEPAPYRANGAKHGGVVAPR